MPTKITVFLPTRGDIAVDIKSLGESLYKYTVTPNSVIVELQGIDVYTVSITVSYQKQVSQRISWNVLTGKQQTRYITTDEFPVSAKTLRLTFRVMVGAEPKYPTTEEIAQKVLQLTKEEIYKLNKQYENLHRETRQQIYAFAAFSIIAFASALGAVIYLSRISRNQENYYPKAYGG